VTVKTTFDIEMALTTADRTRRGQFLGRRVPRSLDESNW